MNYFEKIKSALALKGAKGNITKTSEFRAIGLDSLDLVDMIVLLEEELDITISDEEIMEIKIIQDLLDIIEKLKS